jgi:predicted Zn finger-like uncharacterized protein
MAAPSQTSVIIACPNCGTRYQLAREALGKKRMVKCAHCNTAWEALPESEPQPLPASPPSEPAPKQEDQLFTPAEEARMDREFEAVEQSEPAEADGPAEADAPRPLADIVASIAPKPKPKPAPDLSALLKKRQHAFVQRQLSLNKSLPLARLRTAARQVALAALIVILAVMLLFRTDIVRRFPDLAGTYQLLGLGVNIVGLEFHDVRTLKSLRDGSETLTVDARIVSVTDQAVPVPEVIVTLLNAEGESIYEWSVRPDARDLEPGETVVLETQLMRPPAGAEGVRLTFANGPVGSETTVQSEPVMEQHG